MDIIQTLEHEEIARLAKTIPNFAPGDTVIVSVNVVEGTRKRLQAFEGVVIAKRNRSLNSSFIVRKVSSGEGVERTFQTYSPLIASIEVKRRGDVRRAKLYYLRDRSGKSARIKEKLRLRPSRSGMLPDGVCGRSLDSRDGPALLTPRRVPVALMFDLSKRSLALGSWTSRICPRWPPRASHRPRCVPASSHPRPGSRRSRPSIATATGLRQRPRC